ncbi:MAG: hypothetical protein SFW66_09955 [Gammaproteobacteria bacterium]|nr:hypothetical protein [Gammaproteobacteria bacterium]
MITVSLFEFLSLYLKQGNFYNAIETLEDRYQSIDFKVAFSFITFFYVIQNKSDIKKILKSNAIAGFQNSNFDLSHGHDFNINALPAFLNGKINPLWQAVHTGIVQSTGHADSIKRLIAKHMHEFLNQPTFYLDVAFEKMMEGFWCEFMFGENADPEKFSQLRAKLLSALHDSYYDSALKNIPYIGAMACSLYGYMKKNEYEEIDDVLRDFLNHNDDCLFSRFKQNLLDNPDFPQEKVDAALLDNAFVLILALDFIQNAMYETLKIVVESGLKTTEARKQVYTEGLHEGYLFPFRVRVPQENLELHETTVSSGTPIYINLLKSGLYHSSGP